MNDMHTHFTPGNESFRYETWETRERPQANPSLRFTTLLPPPNITGRLHMGHALEHTLIDACIRYQRMLGKETLWLPGTDHAGIATQSLIERQLAGEGLSKNDLGREAFLERTWSWASETQGAITEQMRLLGATPNWERSMFTLDKGPQITTHEAFTRLYNEGLIYRSERTTSWCTGCETTLSDIETEPAQELDGAPTCSRCSSPIERRSTPQWFLKTKPLTKRAREAFLDGEFSIEPLSQGKLYLNWLDNMEDWCLSRQLWWGHRIPIWYSPEGETKSFAPGEAIPEGWEQDEDTLDTWFSSALWPLSTLSWPQLPNQLEGNYPNDLLITGYDLLFFWATRMILLCSHLEGRIPFKRLHLHGMIRDEHGKKMSKSFGNAQDPLEHIEKYGPDTLRLAIMSHCRPGMDISFGQSDLAGSSALLKKLWSICRLAKGNGIELRESPQEFPSKNLLDRHLLSSLNRCTAEMTEAFEKLDFQEALTAMASFIELDLSDLYLTARKGALGKENAARNSLGFALSATLRLLHPIAPFITEELWENLTGKPLSEPLDSHSWPMLYPELKDPPAEREIAAWRGILRFSRSFRATNGISSSTPLPAHISGLGLCPELIALGRFDLREPGKDWDTFTQSPLILRLDPGFMSASIRDSRRLKAQMRLDAAIRQLENPNFSKAPAHIQNQTRERARLAKEELTFLEGS